MIGWIIIILQSNISYMRDSVDRCNLILYFSLLCKEWTELNRFLSLLLFLSTISTRSRWGWRTSNVDVALRSAGVFCTVLVTRNRLVLGDLGYVQSCVLFLLFWIHLIQRGTADIPNQPWLLLLHEFHLVFLYITLVQYDLVQYDMPNLNTLLWSWQECKFITKEKQLYL